MFDGLVLIASCDKIIPGMIMAAALLGLAAFVTLVVFRRVQVTMIRLTVVVIVIRPTAASAIASRREQSGQQRGDSNHR